MPCLNLNRIPYLVTYDPANPNMYYVEGASGITDRVGENFDYYYIQFSCHNSFRIYDINNIVPADIMHRIKHSDVYLVLDNALEPFLSSADSIYQHIVIKAGVPAKKIIFMSAVPTMFEHVKRVAETLGQELINVEWYVLFESMLQKAAQRQPLLTLQSKEYTKKFLNLNRRWRLHRPLLMILLQDRGLLDHGFISFGKADCPGHDWDSMWPAILGTHKDDQELIEIVKRNESIKELPPMYLDTTDLVTNRAEHQTSTDKYYTDTYFSVVNETTYHTTDQMCGVPFLSEKIFKAIAYSHPFILVSYPNSLQYLKKLGYKTFDRVIDESYDTETNDAKRLIMIADEIKRLSNLSMPDLEIFLHESKKVCSHNFGILKYKMSFIHPMN